MTGDTCQKTDEFGACSGWPEGCCQLFDIVDCREPFLGVLVPELVEDLRTI